jgi:CRISPR-associated Csx14 family protein
MANVLLASLGESPAIVPAMYDLLINQKYMQVDRIEVFYPTGGYVTEGYELVKRVFSHDIARPEILQDYELPLQDVNSEEDALNFLKTLYQSLETHQQSGDTVYLSLAGGRKSMSALMAWVAPFFPCVQGLFHVIDPRKGREFPSVQKLYSWDDMTRRAAMRPDWRSLSLVTIPFGDERRISQQLHEKLLKGSVEELRELGMTLEDAEVIREVEDPKKLIKVTLTKRAEKQLKALRHNATRVKAFQGIFDDMRKPSLLRIWKHNWENDKQHERVREKLHFFRKSETLERPVFYTFPKDINHSKDEEIEEVVVCELEIEKPDKKPPYRSLKELTAPGTSFDWVRTNTLAESVLPKKGVTTAHTDSANSENEKILIVPLGVAPMVATQLYVLGTEKEGWNIKQVVLIYPEDDTIIEGAEMVEVAVREYKRKTGKRYQNDVRHIRIRGLRDIDSDEHCILYQNELDRVIQEYNASYSPEQIIVALSGGRKGMAAMSIFSARKAKIRYVYHTLITDREVENDIINETTVEVLQDLRSDQERNHLLLLKKYNLDGEYSRFTLFKMPVFPVGK